jgi:localization factor PodJL
MARGKLWSVKGVSAEAREAAKTTAHNSGQPIGVWIDQAIRMNDDETQSGPEPTASPNPPVTDDINIVTILEALEARVASHADRISEQLAPVRDSISELGVRLERLEDVENEPARTPPAPPPPPTSLPDEKPEIPTSSAYADSLEMTDEVSDSAPPSPSTPRAEAQTEPTAITEDDIRVADASLKSELTGLFDDGVHRNATPPPRFSNTDPFMPPPPPPRRASRAPVLFVIAILLAAGVGIAALAWFGLISPEVRSFFEQGSSSDTDTETQPGKDVASRSPNPSVPAPPPLPPQLASPKPEPAPAAPSVAQPDPAPASLAKETPPGDVPPADPSVEALFNDAKSGVATAQNELGVRYLVGRGVTQNYATAAHWLREAAAQDMTNAQYNLGVLYDSGRGVEADPTEALIWFHSAAENGHGRAQMALAGAYATGRGIERNPDQALKWLRQAANSNVSEAQFSLANILATNPSAHESLIDAYYWYRIADANGVAQASDRAEQVAVRLTPDERAGVNQRVSHFVSKTLVRPPVRPASSSPATAAPEAPAPKLTPAKTTPSAAQIKQIQTLLTQLGFLTGPADGAIGKQTREAIRAYQRELKLPVDGEPSTAFLKELQRVAGAS